MYVNSIENENPIKDIYSTYSTYTRIYSTPFFVTNFFQKKKVFRKENDKIMMMMQKKLFFSTAFTKLNYISWDLDLYINFFKDGIVCMGTAASKNQVICIKNRVKNDRNIFEITAFLCSKAKQGNTEQKNTKSQSPIYFPFILIFFISQSLPFFSYYAGKNVQ